MKRFFTRLFSRFSKLPIEEKFAYISGFIVGITIFLYFFCTTDMISATTLDYKELHQKIDQINQNPEYIFNHECNVTVSSRKITVYLENEECEITATFNKNFDLISIAEEDKAYSWVLVLFGTLIIAIPLAGFTFFLIGAIVITSKPFFCDFKKRKPIKKRLS